LATSFTTAGQGIPTARGGKWLSSQVMRMLERLRPFRGKRKRVRRK